MALHLPKITVVTCSYNSAVYIKRALDSVAFQTYTNIEHILNDSYSEDGTVKIIEEYIDENSEKYPIKYFQTKPQGIAKALNDSLKKATGEIVHFLHSDAYYSDINSLQKAAKYFQTDPQLKWLTGNFGLEINGKQLVLKETKLAAINPELYIKLHGPIHHENTFVKTDTVRRFGEFDEKRKIAIEKRLWLRMSKKLVPKFVDENFAISTIHESSASTKNIRAILEGMAEAREVVALESIKSSRKS